MVVFIQGSGTFGFGRMLVKWIKRFYANSESCVTKNGFATPFYPLERGVRQGCPLSGILFVIGVELLASAIRSDKSINGLSLDSTKKLNYRSTPMTRLVCLKILHRLVIYLKRLVCLDMFRARVQGLGPKQRHYG